jgi:hypothetical protein
MSRTPTHTSSSSFSFLCLNSTPMLTLALKNTRTNLNQLPIWKRIRPASCNLRVSCCSQHKVLRRPVLCLFRLGWGIWTWSRGQSQRSRADSRTASGRSLGCESAVVKDSSSSLHKYSLLTMPLEALPPSPTSHDHIKAICPQNVMS